MIVEGQKVAYAGDSDPFLTVGSIGRVLATSGEAAHVRWETGSKTGSVDLIELHELVANTNAGVQSLASVVDSFESTIDMPAAASLQVRAAYDGGGEDAVLSALDETGHIAMLADHADEVVGVLAARIRADATLAEVLSQLEVDEQEQVVAKIASALLLDCLKEA